MVIWLIGLSGSGKTTLGNKLKDYCDTLEQKSFIIDGDLVRGFFDNDLGYSREERMANIKRIMLAANVLSQSGTIAIVCNISPFEELRQFARRKFADYVEIYLNQDVSALRKDDVKGMYRNNAGKTDIVGLDLKFDKPLYSDLTINTGVENVEQSFQKIVGFLKTRYSRRFG
ncbi:adenylyl-sulfate kinase [Chloroflexota bacterium]